MFKDSIKSLGLLKEDARLSDYTTFKIGGGSQGVFIPKDKDCLKNFLKLIYSEGIRYKVICQGSNLLVTDQGLDCFVIYLDSDYFKNISLEKDRIRISAGISLKVFLDFCIDHNISGFEFLAGVPAGIGGAVRNNFSFDSSSLGDFVLDIEAVDFQGREILLNKGDFKPNYRKMDMPDVIITQVVLSFDGKFGDKKTILEKINFNKDFRRKSQDYRYPCAGCIFKNVSKDIYAGKLIDDCGLKGFSIGGAAVSELHANFIINKNKASFEEVVSLINVIRDKVNRQYGIILENEIEIWD